MCQPVAYTAVQLARRLTSQMRCTMEPLTPSSSVISEEQPPQSRYLNQLVNHVPVVSRTDEGSSGEDNCMWVWIDAAKMRQAPAPLLHHCVWDEQGRLAGSPVLVQKVGILIPAEGACPDGSMTLPCWCQATTTNIAAANLI
jgi:hypothetical protein